ncbi:hypothetical protein TELCIR_15933 [Teladorsagia circumcincta]|uniref:Uncharacterized protein n=1 Tax=Teladorsagia circumcincta TaxID=45464 RepID=A0A2G9TX58_TELCI|nr:hypothetical protein TELCIR_15933 [Teladorsagia circumcincta]
MGRSSHRNTEMPIYRRDSGKKHGEAPPRRVLKDNPVSMLGEEYFNPTYREQHERRNQPNTRHSGLQQPKRRATVVNAHEQEKEEIRGSAIVGETIVITPISVPSPPDESLTVDLPTDLCKSPPSLETHSTARPLINSVSTEKKRKAPSRPTSPKSLLSSLPRRVLNSSSADEDRGEQFPALNNPLNALDADSSSSLSNRGESFEPSNEMKAAILSSTCNEDMEATIGRHIHNRPSVAFIQKQGIVRDRVNMFRQLGSSMPVPLEPVSGRGSLFKK